MKFKLWIYFCAAGTLYGGKSFAQSPGTDRQTIRQQQEHAAIDSLDLDFLQKVLYMNIQEQYGLQIRSLK